MTSADPLGARPAAVLPVATGPGDVGRRVVVRRRLPEGGYGDLLGELVRWDDDVVVRDRHGVEHVTRTADVVAAKRVPPPPERRGRRS